MKLQSLLPIFLILVGSSLSTPAQDGFHEHDGFYLSLSPGFGGGDFQETHFIGNSTLEMSGGTSNLDLKIGGTVVRNKLIVSGDFIGVRMLSPKTTVGSFDLGRDDGEGQQGLLGLGVTYYFMPVNLFLSGTLGVGGFTYVTSDTTYHTDRGPGFQFKVGKEWWVSKNWGLGVSMFFLRQHVSESNDRELDGRFFGFLFNTTFN